MNISAVSGGSYGTSFDPSQMKARFDQMKSKVRESNPDMAKKMDAFESKLDELQKGGGNVSFSDIQKAAKDSGLPDPDQAQGGGNPFAQFGGGSSNSISHFGQHKHTKSSTDYSSYSADGKGQYSSVAQSLLDLIS